MGWLQAGGEDKENDYVHQYSLDRLQQLITPAFESARRSPEKLSAVSRTAATRALPHGGGGTCLG